MALSSRSLGPLLQQDYPELIEAYTRFRSVSLDSRPMFRYESAAFYWDDVFITDPNVFGTFSHNIIYGDPVSALQYPSSIAISESMSRAYFGDANPLGETLASGTKDYRISLVFEDIPDNSHLKYTALLSSNQLEPMPEDEASLNRLLTDASLYTYFLMNENFNGEQFAAVLENFSEDRIAPIVAQMGLRDTSMRFWAQNLADIHFGSSVSVDEPTGNIAYPIGFSVIAVLIIGTACINYMNLSTARFMERAREVGIRKVLGAEKRHLIQFYLAESVLFSLIALMISLILVNILLGLSISESAVGQQLQTGMLFEGNMLLWIVISATAVGLIAGAYPSWYLSNVSPSSALTANSSSSKNSHGVLRYFLVLSQFTVSISIVAAVLLMLDQMQYLASLPLGFEKENKLVVNLHGADLIENYPALRNELLSTPNIQNVSIAQDVPGDRLGAYGLNIENDSGELEVQMMIVMRVGPDYTDTLGMRVLEGRSLSAENMTDSDESIVVNQALVQSMGWEQAIGKEIRGFVSGTVVGVVEDFNFASLHQEVGPQILVGLDDDFSELSIDERSRVSRKLILNVTAGRQEQIISSVGQIMNRFDPNQPFEFSLLDNSLDQQYSSEEKTIFLVSLFSAICVFISCLGLFGLAAFTTAQRTKEIGIRKILGASPSQLFWLLIRNILVATAIAGVLAPIGTIPAINQWLETFAYRVALDLFNFPIATLVVLIIALATVSMQLIKTIRANPVDALRYE